MIPAQITPITLQPTPSVPAPGIVASGVSKDGPGIPPSFTSLAPGTILKGFVLNRDAGGNPILRTSLGDFLLKSEVFLKIGSQVTVRTEVHGQQTRANIIEIDGKPAHPEPSAGKSAASQANVAGDTITRSSGSQAVFNTRSGAGNPPVLQGVLLSTSTASAGQPLLTSGTNLQLNVQSVQLPPPAVGQGGSALTQAQPTANNAATTSASPTSASPPAASTAATGTSAAGAAPLASQTSPPSANPNLTQATQAYSVTGTAAPAAGSAVNPPPLPTSLQPAQTALVTLTVIGQEQDGEPVLQTPLGLVKVTSNITLPTGSTLTGTITQLPNALGQGATAQPLSITVGNLAGGWQSLQDILTVLKSAVGADALAAQLPSLQATTQQFTANPQQFNAGAFLFMTMLKGGDFKTWLGSDNVRALEQAGQGQLLNKAEGEFTALSRLFNEGSSQWQTLMLPAMVDGQLQMIRFFSKRERDKDKDGKEEKGGNTRFVVEVSLSELGEVQLDGLYRDMNKERYFELIIRSETPLEQEAQRDIMAIYESVAAASGLKGSLGFQWTDDFPIHPLGEVLGA